MWVGHLCICVGISHKLNNRRICILYVGWGDWWGHPGPKNLRGVIMGGKMSILSKNNHFLKKKSIAAALDARDYNFWGRGGRLMDPYVVSKGWGPITQ
jgi:hypothetical protein